MAFAGLPANKVAVARRTTPGQGSIAFPATGLQEVPIRLPNCSGCSKVAAHNPCSAIAIQIPHGEHRYQRVPAANVPRVEDWNRIQTAIFLAAYMVWGFIGDDILYNAGAANNGSQFLDYEVLATSGNRLTLRGPNPKRIVIGRSRVNPEWPFADPVTGQYGFLVAESHVQALPVGASVEFHYPSALFDKFRPLIKRVHPPASTSADDVTFDIELNGEAWAAMEPVDLFYPPPDGRYWCRIRWEAFVNPWRNFQAPLETAFTRRRVDIDTADTHQLRNSLGQNCRILWPGQIGGAVRVELFLQGGGSELKDEEWILPRLTTADPAVDSWVTALDLSDLDFEETVAFARVTYHPEATPDDALRVQFAAGCAHAQRDPSGSYNTHGGFRCMAPGASQFAAFRGGRCWKPSCSKFAIGDAAANWGATESLPADLGDADWWSGLWHRAYWILEQGVPGISSARNFSLSVPAGGGPSIASLVGSFTDIVPEAVVSRRVPFHAPAFGQRVTWTDGDGHQRQAIRHGAFFARPDDLSSAGGPDYTWDFASSTPPTAGAIATAVSGWSTKTDALGESMEAAAARMPARLTGRVHVYSYAHGGAAMGRSNALLPIEQTISGCVLNSTEDTAVSAAIRARFGA